MGARIGRAGDAGRLSRLMDHTRATLRRTQLASNPAEQPNWTARAGGQRGRKISGPEELVRPIRDQN